MIEISKVDRSYLKCQSCDALSPLHISIGDELHSRSIRLCFLCITELKDKATTV